MAEGRGPRVGSGAAGTGADAFACRVGAAVGAADGGTLREGVGEADVDADTDADGEVVAVVDVLSSPVHPLRVRTNARPHAATRRRGRAGRGIAGMAKTGSTFGTDKWHSRVRRSASRC